MSRPMEYEMQSLPLSLSHVSRTDRLSTINAMLEDHGLARLEGVGDNASGWSEIIGIHQWNEHPSSLWHDITFMVRRAGGKVYPHTVRFNTNSRHARGVILIPVIDDRVVIIKQFRVAVGTETWELARGFAEYRDEEVTADIKAVPTALVRELGEEVVENACISAVEPIGTIFENTGSHHSSLDVSIVTLTPPDDGTPLILKGSQGLPTRLVSWSELWNPSRLGIRDAHSLAAVSLAREYRES